jgi:predicted transposase YdaD
MVLTGVTTLSLPFIAYWIRLLEKNTNSIKDALIEVTGVAKKAEGKLEGKLEGRIEGKLEGAKEERSKLGL